MFKYLNKIGDNSESIKEIIQTLKNKIMDWWMMEDLDYSEELEKIDKQNQEEETKINIIK